MQIMDGKKTAHLIQEKIKTKVEILKKEKAITPCLYVILIGDDPASQIYVKKKAKACVQAGMGSQILNFSKDVSIEEIQKTIYSLNEDSNVHGILVQLPLPSSLDKERVLSFISPQKDVDGLTVKNIGQLWSSSENRIKPCTPHGIICLLEHYQIPLRGKSAVIVGRSAIVGLPTACLLLEKNVTVTVCHSHTQTLEKYTQQADIVISACGRHHLLKKKHFKKGAVVVDVGIHRIEKEGRFVIEGDVCPDQLEGFIGYLSPVPGGVGPMTIAMLLENTYQLALNQTNQS